MWEPTRLSHPFLEPQLNSKGKDQQQDQAQSTSGLAEIQDQ